MGIPLYAVDAFARERFSGNPAGVCLLRTPRDEAWMSAVAREMNLSETAFLHRTGDEYQLRWFTPTVEVDLCGHATLASAHVLWESGHLTATAPARFRTKSGLLTAERRGAWIELDFPATVAAPVKPPPGLVEALGIRPNAVSRSRFDYLVELDSEDTVRRLAPDFPALGRIDARGIIVTSRASTPPFDFVSRFFAPASGINEDPVTGSTHCALAPYWSRRLDRSELLAYQASARSGVVRTRIQGDRVILGGQAVTVVQGELV